MSNQSNLPTVCPTQPKPVSVVTCIVRQCRAYIQNTDKSKCGNSYEIKDPKQCEKLIEEAKSTGESFVLVPDCIPRETRGFPVNTFNPSDPPVNFSVLVFSVDPATMDIIGKLSAYSTSDLYSNLRSRVLETTFGVHCGFDCKLYYTTVGLGKWDRKMVLYEPEVPESL